jgi:hypothetical protein
VNPGPATVVSHNRCLATTTGRERAQLTTQADAGEPSLAGRDPAQRACLAKAGLVPGVAPPRRASSVSRHRRRVASRSATSHKRWRSAASSRRDRFLRFLLRTGAEQPGIGLPCARESAGQGVNPKPHGTCRNGLFGFRSRSRKRWEFESPRSHKITAGRATRASRGYWPAVTSWSQALRWRSVRHRVRRRRTASPR